MTENSDNQHHTPSQLSKGFKTSVGMSIVAFLALQALCICVGLMDAVGSPYFNLISVVPLILFVGLGLTIFLVFRRRESLSQSAKVSLGLILVLWATIYASFVVGSLDFFLDGFFSYDSALYYILAVFVIGMLVSLWYFSDQNFQRRSIIMIHAIVAILFMVFFVFQYANVRKNQALVLQAYNDSFPPAEGISIYNVEYSFWSTEAYIIVPDSQYAHTPTFWERSTWGDYYDFEFVHGKWIFAGTKGYFLGD